MNNETKIQLQQELIDLYEQQIMDLTMMSKIELGDDVIEEINRRTVMDNTALKRELSQIGSGQPIVFQVHRQSLEPVPRIFISLTKP